MYIYRNIRHIEAIIYSIGIIFLVQFISAIPLYADEAKQQEFINRINSVCEAFDIGSAYLGLWYLDPDDTKSREQLKKMTTRSGCDQDMQITFESLPDDYNPLQSSNHLDELQ